MSSIISVTPRPSGHGEELRVRWRCYGSRSTSSEAVARLQAGGWRVGRRLPDADERVRNVSPTYPPTMLLHGTADTDVPYDRSVEMARELGRHGVQHELVTVPGAEHGLVGGDQQQAALAHAKALAFLRSHLA